MDASERYAKVVGDSKKRRDKALEQIDAEHFAIVEPIRQKYLAANKKAYAAYDKVAEPARKIRDAAVAPTLQALKDVRLAAGAVKLRKRREVLRKHSTLAREASNTYEQSRRGSP